MGPTEPGNHYLQDQEPQVCRTREITVRGGTSQQASGEGKGSERQHNHVSPHAACQMKPVLPYKQEEGLAGQEG